MLTSPVDSRAALDAANDSDLVQKKIAIDAMRKRVSSGPSDDAKLRDACEGFESVFLQKMWEQMRKNVNKEGYLHSKDEEAYQSMFDVELAKKMASAGGIGLGEMLYEQLSQKLHKASKTTGTGALRTPLPIDPAIASLGQTPKAQASTPAPADLYSEVPEEAVAALPETPAAPEVPETPEERLFAKTLEELAASRDPSRDPANATYPMFDLQTGSPMNPVADRMKEESAPGRDFDVIPMPERVSAPGKARPSNSIRAARQSRRASKAAENIQAAQAAQANQANQAAQANQANQAQRVNESVQMPPVDQTARQAPRQQPGEDSREYSFAAPENTGQMPESVRPAAANAHQAAESMRPAAENISQTPRVIQADPGAIPASTVGEPANGRAGQWPVRGEVVSEYGRQQDATWNRGVTLAAAPSSPVFAPEDGAVTFAGEKGGVQQLVIAHAGGLTSHYSNVATSLVPGDTVQKGMEFATVLPGGGNAPAQTEDATGRMYFEVRRGELAINPETLLA